MSEIKKIQELLREFAKEREWENFHSPKNLSMALSIEAAELLELFLWKTDEDSFRIKEESETAVKEEMADVFLYLLRLADILDINLVQACLEKMQLNKQRYPVDLSKGNNKKYTKLCQ